MERALMLAPRAHGRNNLGWREADRLLPSSHGPSPCLLRFGSSSLELDHWFTRIPVHYRREFWITGLKGRNEDGSNGEHFSAWALFSKKRAKQLALRYTRKAAQVSSPSDSSSSSKAERRSNLENKGNKKAQFGSRHSISSGVGGGVRA